MGRRAKNKQADPSPLPGSDAANARRQKGKKRAPSAEDDRKKVKATKGVGGQLSKDRQIRVERVKQRLRKVDEVEEEDSELDEALQPGYATDLLPSKLTLM